MDDNVTIATAIQSSVSHQETDPTSDTASMFPTETYERIIDFLAYQTLSQHPYGPRPLALCCLTSRSWFPRSRFHLYFQVHLGSRTQFEKFVRGIEINPSHSDSVKKLIISPLKDDQGWLSAVPLLLAPKLKNLSLLSLGNLDLASLHPSFFQYLSLFSTLPSLQLFDGEYYRLSLMRMVSAFPCLQKLRSQIHLSLSDDEAAALALVLTRWKKPFPLRHLLLDEPTTPILLPALLASRTPLTSLYFILFHVKPEDVERTLLYLGSLLLSCRTLRTARLIFYVPEGHIVRSHLSFSSLSDLHHLLLQIPIAEVEDEDISAVARLLSTISAHSLQFLQLDLYIKSNPEILDASAPWEGLNEALLLPNLRSTRQIAVSMRAEGKTYAPKLQLFRLLPALKSMNVVNLWSNEHFNAFWDKL